MPFAVSCRSCGARFSVADDLYHRRFAGRIVTLRCKHCQSTIRLDASEPPPPEPAKHVPPVDARPKWVPRPAPPPPRPRQRSQGVLPNPDALDSATAAASVRPESDRLSEPVDLTEFAHSERSPLLEPEEEEQTLARIPLQRKESPPSSSSEFEERPFALVNPQLPVATLGTPPIPEHPEPSDITTPPSGTEGLSHRSKRGSSGLLLAVGVLSVAAVGVAVVVRGEPTKPVAIEAPRESAPASLEEASPPEISAATPTPEPSAAEVEVQKQPEPETRAARAQPAAPRVKPAAPLQQRPPAETESPPAAAPPPAVPANPLPSQAATRPSQSASATEAVDTPFDRDAAASALTQAAQDAAASCRKPGEPTGTASTMVTFAPSGRVTTALLSGPPFAGTETGSCIAAALRRARIPAFAGEKVTVGKTIIIR